MKHEIDGPEVTQQQMNAWAEENSRVQNKENLGMGEARLGLTALSEGLEVRASRQFVPCFFPLGEGRFFLLSAAEPRAHKC